jgi:hypothetical protein
MYDKFIEPVSGGFLRFSCFKAVKLLIISCLKSFGAGRMIYFTIYRYSAGGKQKEPRGFRSSFILSAGQVTILPVRQI